MNAEAAPPGDRLLPILLIVGAVSFLTATVLGIFGDDLRTLESPGASSYSRSALGHHAFAELLNRRGIETIRSRSRSGAKAGEGLLILAEPQIDGEASLTEAPDEDRLSLTVDGANHILLTLPKWVGEADANRRYLERARLESLARANQILDALDIDVAVYRPSEVEFWHRVDGEAVTIELESPQLVTPGTANALFPIVESERGILLAEVRPPRHRLWGTRLFILSDPDLMANHTLSGDNDHAWLLTTFIRDYELDRGPIVFDEVLHGFGYQASFWRQLFDYPFVLVTLQIIQAALILAWASFGRFGSAHRDRIGHTAGWEPLIANTADLLRYGQHDGHAIGRYYRGAVRDVESKLVPRHLEGEAATRWLEALSRRKMPELDLDELRATVKSLSDERKREHAVMQVARRIHCWKEEMLNASR